MKMMKAAVLHAPGDLRVEQAPMPVPGPGDALVRVTACGVCGSDIPRVCTTGTYHFPTIPGHEMAGVIEQIVPAKDADPGVPAAPGLAVGDAVSVVPLVPCHRCRFCEIGQFAQCERYDFMGSRCDGGFAQYLKAPLSNLVRLPPGTTGEEGALLEPIAVALHAVRNLGLAGGESVAVFGLGAIGNFVAQWGSAFGASRVFGIDVSPAKAGIARAVGLPDSIDASGVDVVKLLRESTGGAGVDLAFDASGSPSAINQAIAALRAFGRLGLLGRPTEGVTIEGSSFEKILRGELTMRGTWSFQIASFPRHAWTESAEALARGAIKTGPLITHRVSLEELPAAIRMMAAGKEFFHKVMVLP
ncbi:MAG: galactitol-1-phosphate 5-dehydrogenase [Spirochaetia bacterium]|jgi:L-iditol 2-dehydrogenase